MIFSKTKRKKIFVTTGSSLEFDLLSEELDKINKNKEFEIIIQIGCGKFFPKNCKYFKFEKNISSFYDWADVVVTHTGAGTLFELLEKKKKVISVANPFGIYGIYELPIYLDKKKYIKYVSYININELKNILENIFNNKIKFKIYKKEKQEIGKEIIKYLKC
jgi:beta-1,4-N-acetylglucosaminyltransferase